MFPFFHPTIDNPCMTPAFCSEAFMNGWQYANETWPHHSWELNLFEIFSNGPQAALRLKAEADPASIWTEADSSALLFFFDAGFSYYKQRRKKFDEMR